MHKFIERSTGAAALLAVALTIGVTAALGASHAHSATTQIVAEARAYLAQLKHTTNSQPTGFAPVTVPKGKTIGIVNCGAIYVACARTTTAVEKAVTAAGWKPVALDAPSFTPAGLSSPMEQLVSEKVNAIIAVGGPDSARPVAMTQAKTAGIPVSCVFCGNAGSKPISAPASANVDADYAAQGKAAAAFIISRSDGRATVAVLENSVSAAVVARQAAFVAYLKKCAGCKVVVSGEPATAADPVAAARNLVTAWLTRFPQGKLNYLVVGADSQAPGPSEAIIAAKRTDVKIVGYDCELPSLAQIRGNGPEIACVNTPLVWQAWAGVDQAVRILAGHKGANVITPSGIVTKSAAPPAGKYVQTFNVASFYSKLWKRG